MGGIVSGLIVDSDNAMEQPFYNWVTEASTLELPPGEWPLQIETTLGNGQPFIRAGQTEDETRVYYPRRGCLKLTVFTD